VQVYCAARCTSHSRKRVWGSIRRTTGFPLYGSGSGLGDGVIVWVFHDYGFYQDGNEVIRVLIEPTFIAADEGNKAVIPVEEVVIRKIALAK
jgi:hypothetical protein